MPKAPFLFWKRSCTAYTFNEDVFDSLDQMNESEVRTAFRAAFDTWAKVDCDGRSAFFVEQRSGTTDTSVSEYSKSGQNEMVVLAIDSERWSQLPDHSPRAIAMTLMWHNKKTGEILDTDVELNLGAGIFADCVAGSCDAGKVDLQNTMTHEAGHVLGLGHSLDTSSTMTSQTVGTVDTQKRTLAPDDEAGYCALDLPEGRCTGGACSCDESESQAVGPTLTNSAGCQIETAGTRSRGWAWLTALIALVALLTIWRAAPSALSLTSPRRQRGSRRGRSARRPYDR